MLGLLSHNFIMPPPTLVEGGIMFSCCPSIRPAVSLSVCMSMRPLRYIGAVIAPEWVDGFSPNHSQGFNSRCRGAD